MGHKQHAGDDEGAHAERAREIGPFRYALIRAAADPALTTRQRGPLVRDSQAKSMQRGRTCDL